MHLDEILVNMLTGEPVHDGIVVGIVFVCFYAFYTAIFSGLFSIFKK